jgi:hypothetical protein
VSDLHFFRLIRWVVVPIAVSVSRATMITTSAGILVILLLFWFLFLNISFQADMGRAVLLPTRVAFVNVSVASMVRLTSEDLHAISLLRRKRSTLPLSLWTCCFWSLSRCADLNATDCLSCMALGRANALYCGWCTSGAPGSQSALSSGSCQEDFNCAAPKVLLQA